MSEKKSKRLSIDGRTKILERLASGKSGASPAAEYGVTNAAISLIKNKENILKQKKVTDDAHGNSSKKKKFTGVEISELDKCLYKWFVQKRSIGDYTSGPMLQEKALLFNELFNGPASFKASHGFLHRFKVRHRIKLVSVQKDKLCSDKEASQTFCQEIAQYLQDKGYAMHQIYNADETGLLWRILPGKSRVTEADDHPGRNMSKDRVTVMVCANATGTHKLPLLIVGKSQNPRCPKNMKVLPVIYRGEKNSFMTRKLTLEWYKEAFLPQIDKVHGLTGGKCILLLDNAPIHPPIKELNALSDKCEVRYLPTTVTSLLQPVDQGIIEKMKTVYKRNLLRLVLAEKSLKGMQRLIKSLTMLHWCNFLGSAWNEVTEMDIRNGWNNFFPQDISAMNIDYDLQSDAFCEMIRQLPGQEELTVEEMNQWLNQDDNEPGWKILSDEEIVSGVELDND